jgi:hypothetical protein
MFGRKPSQRTADLARKPASGSADHRRLVAGPGHPTEPSRPLGHTRQREQEIIAAKDKAEMALEFLQTDMARVQCLPLGDTAPLWDVRYARLSASLATGHHAILCAISSSPSALCLCSVCCPEQANESGGKCTAWSQAVCRFCRRARQRCRWIVTRTGVSTRLRWTERVRHGSTSGRRLRSAAMHASRRAAADRHGPSSILMP